MVLTLAACASAHGTNAAPTTTTTLAETTTTSTTTTTTSTLPPVPVRVVTEQAWIAFGVAVDVTLHYPSPRVERIGFHQSNNEGACDRAARHRDTGDHHGNPGSSLGSAQLR